MTFKRNGKEVTDETINVDCDSVRRSGVRGGGVDAARVRGQHGTPAGTTRARVGKGRAGREGVRVVRGADGYDHRRRSGQVEPQARAAEGLCRRRRVPRDGRQHARVQERGRGRGVVLRGTEQHGVHYEFASEGEELGEGSGCCELAAHPTLQRGTQDLQGPA